MLQKLSALCISILVSGCTGLTVQPDPVLLDEIRGDSLSQSSPALIDILEMSEELKTFVDTHIDRSWRTKKRLEVLRGILFSPDQFAIEYRSGKTKTAIETYQSRSGNCMSMTNLFVAMARYSGLDANYHLVTTRPEWDQSGNTLIWTQHINSTGMLRNGDRYVLDFLPQLRAVEDKTETVSDQFALAIYYNNLGAEAILNQQYQQAVAYLRLALGIQPDMADTWNNMGAAQNRLKRVDLAKASFQRAIQLDSFNNTAMSNLSRLYFSEGNDEFGKRLSERVAKYRSKNPYYRYANARSAIVNQDYVKALKELDAAIRLKKDEAIFFDAMAEVYAGLGDAEKQQGSVRLAQHLRDRSPGRSSNLEIYRAGNVVIH